jgi:hypothetical protein
MNQNFVDKVIFFSQKAGDLLLICRDKGFTTSSKAGMEYKIRGVPQAEPHRPSPGFSIPGRGKL